MKSRAPYYSPLRQAQAAATRARILAACAAVMQRGAELTYSAVAAEAEVRERTVYRYFPTKAALEAGLWDWIIATVSHANFAAQTEDELVASMRSSFAGFDTAAPLIQAMLHSPQGLEIRRRQQDARRALFETCVATAVPHASPQTRERAAAALQVLYSAAAWELLRSFWDMDAVQAADVVELGIRALLAGLRAEAGAAPPGRAPPTARHVPADSGPHSQHREHGEHSHLRDDPYDRGTTR